MASETPAAAAAAAAAAGHSVVVVTAPSLPSQPWWPALHSTIITSFRRKDIQAFPPSWSRLNPDPAAGAEGLAKELGSHGALAVIFDDDAAQPVACGGVLPFRGERWIAEVTSADGNSHLAADGDNGENATAPPPPNLHPQAAERGPDWEICCFCVHPDFRGRGLSHRLLEAAIGVVRPQGATRLVSNYSIEETGDYWPKMGFTTPLGGISVLKKGFASLPGMEGLRDDIHFKMSAMNLQD